MKQKQINYTRALVIVHGKSEYHVVSKIKRNLRLSFKIHAKKGGTCSILIPSLLSELNTLYFKSMNEFCKEFHVEREKGKLKNFKLFIVMDPDNIDKNGVKSYMNRSMFKNHWLKDYIVPILSDPNLDEVLYACSFFDKVPNNKEKMDYYNNIFEIDYDSDLDAIEQMREISNKLKKHKKTNLYKLIDYCILWAESNKLN